MTSPTAEATDVRSFWDTVEFWPTRYERWFADRWPYLILVPFFLLTMYGFAFVVIEGPTPSELVVSYKIAWCRVTRVSWCRLIHERSVLQNVGTHVPRRMGSLDTRGSVDDTPPAHYLEFSKDQTSRFSSPWRFLPILSCVAFSFAVNSIVGIELLRGSTFHTERPWLVVFTATMTVALCAWSYAVGAVAWCFCVAAQTLWSLSSNGVRLRVFFGHPDNCGGLRPLGDASLGMTYPLLVGCVLLTIWALPDVVSLGISSSPSEIREFVQQWYFGLLVPAARVALVAIIGLTAALFFGPLWKIHRRMAAVRREYENEYARQLDQLMRANSATVLNASDSDVKQASERLRYLQNLSPESLRLSDWPIDSRMVATYLSLRLPLCCRNLGRTSLISLPRPCAGQLRRMLQFRDRSPQFGHSYDGSRNG